MLSWNLNVPKGVFAATEDSDFQEVAMAALERKRAAEEKRKAAAAAEGLEAQRKAEERIRQHELDAANMSRETKELAREARRRSARRSADVYHPLKLPARLF